MKNTILTICLLSTLILPLWHHACLAASQGKLLAAVQISQDLKPELAPGTPTKGVQAEKGGVANYVLQLIAGSLIFLAGPTAILFLAVGGLRYVTSRGNQPQMDGAKKTITYAIVGLIVILLSLAIVTNVIRMIGGI